MSRFGNNLSRSNLRRTMSNRGNPFNDASKGFNKMVNKLLNDSPLPSPPRRRRTMKLKNNVSRSNLRRTMSNRHNPFNNNMTLGRLTRVDDAIIDLEQKSDSSSVSSNGSDTMTKHMVSGLTNLHRERMSILEKLDKDIERELELEKIYLKNKGNRNFSIGGRRRHRNK
jgi:hypothetical protein